MCQTLRLRLRPEWQNADRARCDSAAFLRQAGVSADVVDAVSMVTCELTENATKYGSFVADADAVDVAVRVDSPGITVEVKSPLGDTEPAHLRRLDRMVQWIRGFQDPFEAYLERLREISECNLGDRESGLGLARIAYEGQSVVDFYVNEDNVLAVSAVFSLSAKEMQ